jgi:hypothetical protein
VDHRILLAASYCGRPGVFYVYVCVVCAVVAMCGFCGDMAITVIWPSRHSPRPEAIELKEEVETHNSQRACDVLEAILILNKLSTRGHRKTRCVCEPPLTMAV